MLISLITHPFAGPVEDYNHPKIMRRAHIADACLLGLAALGIAALAASILFPPLALPLVTGAILAAISLSSFSMGGCLAAISLACFTGAIIFSIQAHEKTLDIEADEYLNQFLKQNKKEK